MFISELIAGRYYYVAEGSSMRKSRWSIVPHKPGPSTPVHRIQVPRRIRDLAQKMFDDDGRRRYNEEKNNEIRLRDCADIRHVDVSVGAANNRPRPRRSDRNDHFDRLERADHVS